MGDKKAPFACPYQFNKLQIARVRIIPICQNSCAQTLCANNNETNTCREFSLEG